jgi:hypothetical protein
MANVILTHFSGIFTRGEYKSSCYYDGIVRSLLEMGHDVLHILTSDFLVRSWNGSNTPYSRSVHELALNKIKAFKPDIIISFNNSSIAGIEDVVDCPIAVWDADSFQFFNDKETLIKKQDRWSEPDFSDNFLT